MQPSKTTNKSRKATNARKEVKVVEADEKIEQGVQARVRGAHKQSAQAA